MSRKNKIKIAKNSLIKFLKFLFYINLIFYIIISVFLIIINVLTSTYIWAIWPIIGWGVLVLFHYAVVYGIEKYLLE